MKMKNKIKFCFSIFVSALFMQAADAAALHEDAEREQFLRESREELDALNVQIQQYKAEGRKLVLVLGAVPSETNHFSFTAENGFENAGIVYFNDYACQFYQQRVEMALRPEWFGQLITGDFNHLDSLKRISDNFPKAFDLIISDYGTDHYMQFTAAHFGNPP
jgi:hypothetical protein